jgi:hypothetical protein
MAEWIAGAARVGVSIAANHPTIARMKRSGGGAHAGNGRSLVNMKRARPRERMLNYA